MRKSLLAIISVGLIIFSGVSILLTLSETTHYTAEKGDETTIDQLKPQVFETPQNYSSINKISGQWASYVKKLTYEKLLNSSDIVAIVEIGTSTTYFHRQSYHFTLYEVKVVEVFRGKIEDDEIQIQTIGGYNPITGDFQVLEGCPIFAKGDRWLVFLKKMGESQRWGDEIVELPRNTYYLSPACMGLKIVDGKLYTIEDTGPSPAPQLKVNGLAIEEFKSLYIGP